MCSFIEEWWGEKFDKSLIRRIATAPAPMHERFVAALQANAPKIAVEPVGEGDLRPILPRQKSNLSLRLLLYSHEVLVDSGSLGWPLSPFAEPGSEVQMRASLSHLMNIRPLMEEKILRITPVNSRGRHPSAAAIWDQVDDDVAEAIRDGLEQQLAEAGLDVDVDKRSLHYFFDGITGGCLLAAYGAGQTLVTTEEEHRLRDALLQSATLADQRQTRLTTLASLSVPDLTGNEGLLVQLRRDSEQFASWRSALGEALSYVREVPESDDGARDAAAIVSAELKMATTRLVGATQKSPVLSTLKKGTAEFGLAGLGVGAGLLVTGGNPLGGILGAGAPATVRTIGNYVSSVRQKRKGKAILDVAALFQP